MTLQIEGLEPVPTSFETPPVAVTDRARSRLAARIDMLERLRTRSTLVDRSPQDMPLELVDRDPEAFQPRTGELDERHISDLRSALKVSGDLEPILVMPCGNRVMLIDGHHRLDTYRLEERCVIPVVFFEGTAREAVLEAGKRNSRPKLAMNNRDRQNHGWRLVLSSAFTKSEVQQASGISKGQVDNMRSALRLLGEEAECYAEWWRAREAWQAKRDGKELEEKEIQDRMTIIEERGKEIADRWCKITPSHIRQKPEILAFALKELLGRHAYETSQELAHLCMQDPSVMPEGWDAPDDENDDY